MAIPKEVSSSINILGALTGFIAGPTPIGFLTTGLSVAEQVTALLKPEARKLKNAVAVASETAEQTFASWPEAPSDARILYAQMIERAYPKTEEAGRALLFGKDLDANKIAAALYLLVMSTSDDMHPNDVTDFKKMEGIFEAVTEAALGVLLDGGAVQEELQAQFRSEVLSRLSGQTKLIDELKDMVSAGNAEVAELAEKMERNPHLRGLAYALEIPDYETISVPELTVRCSLVIAELKALREKTETAPKTDLVDQARDAILRLDLSRARALLAEADKEASEQMIEIKVMRASAELAGGAPRDARRFILQAVMLEERSDDGFAHLLAFQKTLNEYARAFGGDAVAENTALARDTLSHAATEAHRLIANSSLGAALRLEAQNTGLQATNDEAISILENALAALPQAYRAREVSGELVVATANNLSSAISLRADGQTDLQSKHQDLLEAHKILNQANGLLQSSLASGNTGVELVALAGVVSNNLARASVRLVDEKAPGVDPVATLESAINHYTAAIERAPDPGLSRAILTGRGHAEFMLAGLEGPTVGKARILSARESFEGALDLAAPNIAPLDRIRALWGAIYAENGWSQHPECPDPDAARTRTLAFLAEARDLLAGYPSDQLPEERAKLEQAAQDLGV